MVQDRTEFQTRCKDLEARLAEAAAQNERHAQSHVSISEEELEGLKHRLALAEDAAAASHGPLRVAQERVLELELGASAHAEAQDELQQLRVLAERQARDHERMKTDLSEAVARESAAKAGAAEMEVNLQVRGTPASGNPMRHARLIPAPPLPSCFQF